MSTQTTLCPPRACLQLSDKTFTYSITRGAILDVSLTGRLLGISPARCRGCAACKCALLVLCGVHWGAARWPMLYPCWVDGLPQGGARFAMQPASLLTAPCCPANSGLSYSTDTAMNQSFYGNKASCTRLPRCRTLCARQLRDWE